MSKIKEFQTPTQINSAHLHPQLKYFVAGGHDFKIYKFDYETGQECDSYKGMIGFWVESSAQFKPFFASFLSFFERYSVLEKT